MQKKQNIVAIIPARGGSKGIPHKNIMNFCGKPLLHWSVNAGTESKYVSKTYVSTDDKKISRIARESGAEIIMRPNKIATDISSSEDALIHAINTIEKKMPVDIVVFLQATSPLREHGDIDSAIERFINTKVHSLFSASKLKDYFIWEKINDKYTSVNYDYLNRKPRQEIKTQYLENGSIYIFTPELIKREHNRLGGNIGIYEMPDWKSYQIDDIDDIEICEYYFSRKILNHE